MIHKIKVNKFNWNIFYQLLLIVLICWLYSYSWNYPIMDVWDDQYYILYNNKLVLSLSNVLYWFTHKCVGVYLPVTMLSYMFDYSIWGLNSFGYHLQNIFWHIVVTIVIYHCFRLFKIKSWIAFFLCLIFAVHPQRIESVVWLSERKDVLCAAFYFLSIYFYLKKYTKPNNINTEICRLKAVLQRFPLTSFIFFILAMLSKPMAVSLPIVLVLYEFYQWRKTYQLEAINCRDTRCVSETCNMQATATRHAPHASTKKPNNSNSRAIRSIRVIRGSISRLLPFFIFILLFIPITIITQTDFEFVSPHIPIYTKLYIALFNIYWYFKETLFSTDLNPLYPMVTLFYSSMKVIVFYISCFILFLFLFLKKRSLFLYKVVPLILCFMISLLPVIGLIKLGAIDRADRYSYIPSVFIWFGIGIILNEIIYRKNHKKTIFSNKKFIFLILVAYLSVLIINNIKYQQIWKNKFSLFNYSAQCTPFSHIAIIYLIEIEYDNHNYNTVLKLADRLAFNPNLNITADCYKALAEYMLNKKTALKSLVEVELKLKAGIKFKVIHDRYIKILGYIIDKYDSIGNSPKVLEYLNIMLDVPNLNSLARFSCLGLKNFYLNKYEESIIWYKKALEISPGNKFVVEKLKKATRLSHRLHK